MNLTALIAALTALVAGGAAGMAISEKTQDGYNGQQYGRGGYSETVPLPEDFVSVRPAVSALPAEDLSAEEEEDLIFMREEEKLARDVYMTLYEKWGTQIFANIAQSEQTHTEAIRNLIEKYDLTDPVTDDTIGVFTNEELAGLYDALVEQGSGSLADALTVGATIEDLDIKDLQEAALRADNEDIALVYGNLERGSRNHLRSFTSQLEREGEEYEPQYISEAEYEDIVGSDRERGAGMGDGATMNGSGSRGGGQGGTMQGQGGQGQGGGQGRGGGAGRGWGGNF